MIVAIVYFLFPYLFASTRDHSVRRHMVERTAEDDNNLPQQLCQMFIILRMSILCVKQCSIPTQMAYELSMIVHKPQRTD